MNDCPAPRAPITAEVRLTVAPEAACGVCRAYPVGEPGIRRLPDRCGEARYVLRQPFVAEIPLTIRSGVRACRPRVRLRGACARGQAGREGKT